MNVYLQEELMRERMAEARAIAAQAARIRDARPPGRPLRLVLGLALIRAGHWIAGRGPRRAGLPRRASA